jgi:hypothetical protein
LKNKLLVVSLKKCVLFYLTRTLILRVSLCTFGAYTLACLLLRLTASKHASEGNLRFCYQAFFIFLYHSFEKNGRANRSFTRRLVEAMGVEPMSALTMVPGTPCTVFDYTAYVTAKTRYNVHGHSVILICPYRVAESKAESYFGLYECMTHIGMHHRQD